MNALKKKKHPKAIQVRGRFAADLKPHGSFRITGDDFKGLPVQAHYCFEVNPACHTLKP